MELMIGEKLRKLRRDRDMTQEMLASAFGVSPQAISKWECGDGYPDITMLPMIANYFKVTIDELMGNDEIGQREDFQLYHNTYHKIRDTAERVEYILGYVRKYPNEYRIATDLTRTITELPKEKWEEYLPVLRETAEKIVNECTIQWMREHAIRDMCLVCPDEEFEHWEQMCAAQYEAYRGEVIEKRLAKQGRKAEAIFQHAINNFELVCHFLVRYNHDHFDWERIRSWNKKQMKFLEFLGGGDEIPEIWRGRYAYCALNVSWSLFGAGDEEEGYVWLERAFELYDRWCAIPDGTPLDTGDPELFGGIKGIHGMYDAHAWDLVLPDGTYQYFHVAHAYMLFEKSDIYHMLIHWHGTENVRETERMQPYIARAKALAGIEE